MWTQVSSHDRHLFQLFVRICTYLINTLTNKSASSIIAIKLALNFQYSKIIYGSNLRVKFTARQFGFLMTTLILYLWPLNQAVKVETFHEIDPILSVIKICLQDIP